MDSSYAVRIATTDDCALVGSLVYELITELSLPHVVPAPRRAFIETASTLLSGSNVWAFLAASANQEVIGVLTLNECASIYAGGRFGEIAELYVRPTFRGRGIGAALVQKATAFAISRGWRRLEVGAPSLPRWERTVAFYRRCGFAEVGPRLSRRVDSGATLVP